MQNHFDKFRSGILGLNKRISTPVHVDIPLVYADWTASGRMYGPIEERMQTDILPYVANTHTDTNYTGSKMTYAYHKAQSIIKQHVRASQNDVLISSNSGMTGVVNKFQRILGLKVHEKHASKIILPEDERPIIFITHMEHHSNQTSWLETLGEVVVVPPDENGLVSLEKFSESFKQYGNRSIKIAAITSCSNVTGIRTPYMDIAQEIHVHNGLCFVDFACSAPYVEINMHEDDQSGRYLDAIYFSPHKFLGGPGTTGILVFNESLYSNSVPDNPGGGTVDWTNPWGEHKFVENIEAREDGGTPSFLQTIKAAMCMQLKDEMGVDNILKQEHELLKIIWDGMNNIPNLHILGSEHKNRLGIISFYIDDLHYNLGVKMLNDRFGVQTRGGCSCAGTYGHYLLNVSKEHSKQITDQISIGNCSSKPGWIRMSIHPTQEPEEVRYIVESIKQLAQNHHKWKEDYLMDYTSGTVRHKIPEHSKQLEKDINECFERTLTI